MDERYNVRDITIERDTRMSVTFGDERIGHYDLIELRVHCPCAGCRGAREKGQAPWSAETALAPLAVTSANLVGAWGLSITWNDGHRAGIFPFRSLYQWARDGEPPLTPDSGLSA